MTLALRAERVQRLHRGGRGVGPLDLEVGGGETVCLAGPNGSGKTTLLRLLATIDHPGGGELVWWGSRSRGAARRRLGVALDAAVEEPVWSGRQAAAFWCRQWVRDRRAARRLVDAALARFGLEPVADEPVGAYSFGMRRRLALVQALAHVPALAVLDEPTAGLDPAGVAVLCELLAERRAGGLATVAASNDAAFVERAADRVLLLRDGRAVRTATPQQLLALLAGARVVEVDTTGPVAAEAVARLAGVTRVHVRDDGITVHVDGEAALAAIVAAVDAPAGTLRELRARAPDLADGFGTLTGGTLTEPPAPSAPAPGRAS